MAGLRGIPFAKMSGSGNDFVVVDSRKVGRAELEDPATIQRICARGTGVGADGVVLLAAEQGADFRMVYFNADGSRASMCGNAALCCTRLFAELEAAGDREVAFETDSGRVTARLSGGEPEIDLAPVEQLHAVLELPTEAGESRIGHVLAGVPHVTVLVDDVDAVDVVRRGRAIRTARELMPAGANANFVSGRKGEWRIRTYERGVEGETLACGTGAIGSAILIASWGLDSSPIRLTTRSGRTLTVTLRREGSLWYPSLAGEGRIVFRGELGEL
ncbi:MAG: diaminopimelate epimerase [Gemmatimonadaceae bacterium]|nr:diaminopimelate epimerase [Gemmatimonadaceae bacterium]NUQ91929.1 diaminopimelate epimerase [Gemmatimonadaceae bacterium]NUR19933.1 diaminopimelate epimerase [Gemmatimonadaceae bacterium]NUS96642.1 diaminopimelate epimerase [Gemmatimonadaceae bacterium]